MSFRKPCHMPFRKLIPFFYPHRQRKATIVKDTYRYLLRHRQIRKDSIYSSDFYRRLCFLLFSNCLKFSFFSFFTFHLVKASTSISPVTLRHLTRKRCRIDCKINKTPIKTNKDDEKIQLPCLSQLLLPA